MIKLLDAAFSVTDRAWQELKKKKKNTHTQTRLPSNYLENKTLNIFL